MVVTNGSLREDVAAGWYRTNAHQNAHKRLTTGGDEQGSRLPIVTDEQLEVIITAANMAGAEQANKGGGR
jgi:hypothetical protein